MIAGVQDLEVLHARLAQELGQKLGLLDRGRADEDRLAPPGGVLDLGDDCPELLVEGPVDLVVLVEALDRQVGRDLDDVEPVDVAELGRFRLRRAGHAGQLLVHAEIVLEGDRGERLVLGLDGHALLRLERLVQPLRKPAARHHAAGELVDDHHLVVADDIVLVALEQRVGLQRVVDVVDDRDVLDVVERGALQVAGGLEQTLELLGAVLGEGDGALLLVELVVGLVELRDEGVDRLVELGAVVERPGDDQRRTRLVDQDRVHLVDDRVVVAALDHLVALVLHVVAQIVEAELVVGRVGDVAGVGGAALLVVETVLDDADGQAEEPVDAAHPFGVAGGEVVVDGDDMDALALERVEVDGERRDKRLALAGLHLGDGAGVEHHAADHLHVEMTHPEGALGGLADDREGRYQQVVDGLALGKLRPELGRLAAQFLVAEGGVLVLERRDRADARLVAAHDAFVRRPQQLAGHAAEIDHEPVLPRFLALSTPRPAGRPLPLFPSNFRNFGSLHSLRKAAGL